MLRAAWSARECHSRMSTLLPDKLTCCLIEACLLHKILQRLLVSREEVVQKKNTKRDMAIT